MNEQNKNCFLCMKNDICSVYKGIVNSGLQIVQKPMQINEFDLLKKIVIVVGENCKYHE